MANQVHLGPVSYTHLEFTDVNMVHVQPVKDFVWEPAILQAQTNLRWICDAPAKEGAVDLLLHHGKEQPCDMLLSLIHI